MNFITFLNSSILFVAAAAIIPLLIHLFAKKRPHKVIFSSIKFIKMSQQQQKKRINIKNLLLLIIRMLIIIFVIIGLARPALKLPFLQNSSTHPKTAVAIIIDNSYSMDYLIDTKTDLEKAKDIAVDINDMLTASDVTVLYTLDDNWNKINSRITYGKLKKSDINTLDISVVNKPFEEILEEANAMLKSSHIANREIYFITDMQKQNLPEKIDTQVYFIPTSTEVSKHNISCQNAQLENDFARKGINRRISFDVDNHSDIAQEDIICELNLNGQTIAEKVVNLEPNQKVKEQFQIEMDNTGWYSGYITIKNERYPVDNKSYFSFYYDKSPKVIVFSDMNDIPIPLKSMLEIYTGNSNNIIIENSQTISWEELSQYSMFIVYGKHFVNSPFEFMLDQIQSHNRSLLVFCDTEMSDESKQLLQKKYSLKLGDFVAEKSMIDYVNPYHYLTEILSSNNDFTVSHYFKNSMTKTNDVLLKSNESALVVKSDLDYIVLMDPASYQNPFWLHPNFPVLMFRIFQDVTLGMGLKSENLVGERQLLESNSLMLPHGDGIRLTDNYYVPLTTGIYSSLDNENNPIFNFAVNLNYKESNFTKIGESKNKRIKYLSEDWKDNILQSRYGFEIWKIMFILALILLAIEMIIVSTEKRRNG